jgi:hypothetical protein
MASAMDLLKNAAKKEPVQEKKGKDEHPLLELANTAENKKEMENLIKQKQVKKSAETSQKKSEGVLRPQAAMLREQFCAANKKFHSSVKLKCGDIGPINFITQNKYSEIGISKEDELKAIFGEKFTEYFMTFTEIMLTDKGLAEIDTLLPKLIEACGGTMEKFQEYFNITQTLKPTEFLHEQRVQNPEIKKQTDKAIDDGLLKPQSQSFLI